MAENDVNQTLARSSELLSRVKAQLNEGPSFLGDLLQASQPPTSVPFAPSQISLDDTTHSVQSAGGTPDAPDSPTRNLAADADAQRRIRELFQSRMSKLTESSLPSITPLPEEKPIDQLPAENVHEEEEEIDEDVKTVLCLDEPLVMIGKTTASLLENPITSTADVSCPVTDESAPLYNRKDLAEDGLWVPAIPNYKTTNVERLQNRLLWQDIRREYFFSSDCNMKIDTPPLIPIDPPFPCEPLHHDGEDLLHFNHASVLDIEEYDNTKSLAINVQSIQFLVHPLSTPEDILVIRVRQLYNAYMKDIEFSRTHYYKERIEALRTAILNDPDKEKEYLQQLVEAHQMRDIEEHNTRMLREDLQQAWKDLRNIRSNSFTIYPLTLRWQSKKFTQEQKEQQEQLFEASLRTRAQEIVRLGEINGETIEINDTIQTLRNTHEELALRMPGEPMWKPVLLDNGEVTPLEQLPESEQERRRQIDLIRLNFKCRFNGQQLDNQKVIDIPLNHYFRSDFNYELNYEFNQIPQKVAIEIWEHGGYIKGNRMVASVTIPVTVGAPDPGNYEFTSEWSFGPENQLAMGTISARCYIESTPSQLMIRPPDREAQKIKRRLATDPSSFMSVAKLLEWAETHDPNDPYTASMLASIVAQHTSERVSSQFRLDPDQKSTTFASLVPTSIGMQLQQHMERLRQQDEEQKKAALRAQQTDISLKNIKDNQIVSAAVVKRQVELSDIVKEAPMPNVPSIVTFFKDILNMYRPLKPIRQPRVVSSNVQDCTRIVIRVVRAQNVPERTKLGMGPSTTPSLTYSSTGAKTNIFVRVTYDGRPSSRTKAVSGTSAEWNESFDFPVTTNLNEVPSLDELAKLDIRIDLFDEVSFEIVPDDREQQTHHEMVENRILGTVKIPVSSIWATGKLDGTIPLVSPPLQLGYTYPNDPIRLALYFTLDPPIILPETDSELEAGESIETRLRAQGWLEKMKGNPALQDRRIVLMAKPTSGKPIVCCRMIKKQEPPPGFDDPVQMLRFVSLIPNYSDSEVFNTTGDVWCTSQEFLEINAGDEEEHATLLCNFLKSRGIEAYVAFGYDLINGTTCFVVTREAGRVNLWDPLTCRSWSSKDRFCTLFSVGVVFNEDNVWCNIQSDVEPYKIDWNMHDSKKWYPFFSPEFPKPPLESPQEEHLHYKPLDDISSRRIERELDNSIKSAVEGWRSHQRTSWNPQLSDKIHQTLEACERTARTEVKPNLQNIVEDFAAQYPSYRMNGSPFCLPFTSNEDIINEVKQQEIWRTESVGVDFALGVYVIPYPNAINVVWVMLASVQYIQPAHPPL